MLRRIFSSSKISLILRMFTLFMFFLIFRQKICADAFLLTHRNLLLPFASAQFVKDKHQQQHHLPPVGTTNQMKSAAPEMPSEHHAKLPSERHHVESLDSAKHDAKPKRHSRRKRMHCLSMLRKIGDPRSVYSLSDIVQRHREMIRH
ncbi:hypothetical protein niasHT_021647 [Heterodera trifolii]|uniref:Uncharacterized protein n=1 Tax=Heterodera trifolii TaxID=157864 RepID=A0ABD2JTS0_9BILA